MSIFEARSKLEKIGELLKDGTPEACRKAIPELCEMAINEDWWGRKKAIRYLGGILQVMPIPEATGTLISALENETDDGVSDAIVLAIGDAVRHTDMRGAIPGLINTLGHRNSTVSVNAGWVLSEIGEPAVKPLFEILPNIDMHGQIADRAISALLRMPLAAMPEAIVLLGHENEGIRELCARILLRTGDERAERFGRIIYGCRKTTGLKLSDHKDIEYAAGLGLEIIAETQREFFALIKGRYTEERILEMKRQFAEYYAKVAEELCNRKQDVPMEDTELARLARQRMKEHEAARQTGKQRFSQRLQRAVA